MSNKQTKKIHSEDLGRNTKESRPDQEMRDVLVAHVHYRTGRGYYLNVFMHGETKLPDGGTICTRVIPVYRENPLDMEVRLKEAKRFHAGTLDKLAEDPATKAQLATLSETVRQNYRAKGGL